MIVLEFSVHTFVKGKEPRQRKIAKDEDAKGISRLTVALLYFGAKKYSTVRQAILIDITTFCGTTMLW